MMEILIVAVCLVLNAIFSATEMAFVTIPKPDLRNRAKKGDAKASRLLSLRENPERALSVIQIGITLVGAISAAVGGAGAEEQLSPFFEQRFGFSDDVAEGISIAIVVIPLTYLSVVIGELVPKSIALRYPNQVLKFGTTILHFGIRFLGPIVTVLDGSTKFLLKILLPSGLRRQPEPQPEIDLESLSTHQRQYILNLANIEAKRVREAMLHWDHVQWIDRAAAFEDVASRVIQSGHTRLPVLENGVLVGVLHSKEFISFVASGNRDWHAILRDAVRVRPQDELLTLLRKLQAERKHMAIVFEGDKTVGVITLEDIIEEVVGDIFDEDDDGNVKRLLSRRAALKAGFQP